MAEVRPLNVLIDINVPLDIFLAREPWLPDARAVWAAHNRRAIVGHIAAHGFTNLFDIARHVVGVEKAREVVRLCLQTFEVIPVGRAELDTPTPSGATTSRTIRSSPAPWSPASTPS